MRFRYASLWIASLVLLGASASFAQSSRPSDRGTPVSAPSATQLRNLLGKSMVSEEAKQVINSLPRGAERSEAPEWDTTFISSTGAGLSLKFSGTPRSLSLVVLYAEGVQESRQYPLSLPNGLAFGQSRREIEQRLGPPVRSMGVEGYPFEAEYLRLGLSLSFTGKSTRDPDATLTQVVLLPAERNLGAATPAVAASPRLAFRLVVEGPTKNSANIEMLEEPDDAEHSKKLATLRNVLLDERHIANVGLSRSETSGAMIMILRMTEDGAKRLEQATRANVGRRLAIVLDGRPIIVPVIQGVISKHVTIEFGDQGSKETLNDVYGRLHAAVNALAASAPASEPSTSPSR